MRQVRRRADSSIQALVHQSAISKLFQLKSLMAARALAFLYSIRDQRSFLFYSSQLLAY